MKRRDARSQWLNLRGLRHHLRCWGPENGRPLILCHGWLDTSASWQFVVDAMHDERRIIAPDWRGFGLSEWSGALNYWFQDYVADLSALVDSLSPDQPIDLAGHSMGAQAASLYAGARPERIRRLVLMDDLSVPDMGPELAPKRMRNWLDDQKNLPTQKDYDSYQQLAERVARRNKRLTPERALAVAKAWGGEREDGRIELLADPMHRMHGPSLFRAAESKALWSEVTAHTLFLDADDSAFQKMLGETEMQSRRGCFASSERVVLSDCGHMVHHDQPEAVAAELDRFLDA